MTQLALVIDLNVCVGCHACVTSCKQWNTSGAAGSLLEFAEDNDIGVDSGCRAGSCGSCQTAVKVGEVNYSQEPDADVIPGHCLLCISTPKNNLTLDI